MLRQSSKWLFFLDLRIIMIYQKQIEQITWADLEAMVANSQVENANLEFKKTLSDKNGGEDRWLQGQPRINDHARDELAKEIVAFANVYGGMLLLGIDERAGGLNEAGEIVPLPRAAEFVEKISQSFSQIIDPPLPNLQILHIPSPTDGQSGVVIFKVPASNAAPHGIGCPPEAYVQQTPMTMRDVQSAFWDARTKRERIEKTRQKFDHQFAELRERVSKNTLTDTQGQKFEAGKNHIFVRMTAIPEISFDGFMTDKWKGEWLQIPSASKMKMVSANFFDNVANTGGWMPRAHGIRGESAFQERAFSEWTLLDDGAVNVSGVVVANQEKSYHCDWFATIAAQVAVMAERLRRVSGRPDIGIEFDVSLMVVGQTNMQSSSNDLYGSCSGKHSRNFMKKIDLGPFLFNTTSEINQKFGQIRQEFLRGFGIDTVSENGHDLESAISAHP